MKKITLILLVCIGICGACDDDEPSVDQAAVDEQIIQTYIQDNSLNAQTGAEGLYYVIKEPGSGANPTLDSLIVVNYEGFLLDGTKFDSSIDRGEPGVFPLGGLIPGWQLGLPLLKEGGEMTLLLPSTLGYGNNPPANSSIPPNAVLRFEVELLDVTNQAHYERDQILQYIEENGLEAESLPEGLFYVIEEEGTGGSPTVSSVVEVDYEGFLLDGTKFDSSIDRGQSAVFLLGDLIQGWQLGIPLLQKGGKGIFILPSSLGYGSNPPAGSVIPPNAVLVFEITLIDFE